MSALLGLTEALLVPDTCCDRIVVKAFGPAKDDQSLYLGTYNQANLLIVLDFPTILSLLKKKNFNQNATFF